MNSSLQTVYADTAPVGGYTSTLASVTVSSASAPVEKVTVTAQKHDGLTFHDLLDVVNPLQHIPVVGTLYRAITGDTIAPAARIAGDALYGGLIGLASSVVDTVVETTTGKDIGQHIMATLFGDDSDAAPGKTDDAPANAVSGAAPASPAAVEAAAASGPSDLYRSLQTGGRDRHEIPLSTSIVGLNAHPGQHTLINQGQPGNGWASSTQSPSSATATAPAANTNVPQANTPNPLSALPNVVPNTTPNPLSAVPMASNTATPGATTVIAGSGAVPDMMMKALDQYKAMLQQRPSGAMAGAGGGAINTLN